MAAPLGIVNVVGRDAFDADLPRQRNELGAQEIVLGKRMALQLDEVVTGAEGVEVALGGQACHARIAAQQSRADGSMSASREGNKPASLALKRAFWQGRLAFWPIHSRLGNEGAQV